MKSAFTAFVSILFASIVSAQNLGKLVDPLWTQKN